LGTSTVLGLGAGIWVKPALATTYVVTQTLCGTEKKDTVRVAVWPASVTNINGQAQQYSLLSNPHNSSIHLLQEVADDRAVWIEVFALTGQRVYSQALLFTNRQATFNLPEISTSMYYIRIKDASNSVYSLRLVKQ
jgi:hypothetical protein